MLKKISCALLMSLPIPASLLAATEEHPRTGEVLPELTISGEHGGSVVDGGSWSSQSMKGRLHFVVYVDPDEANLNDELTERLDAVKYPEAILDSVAIINLAASWKPNALILSILRAKQKQYPLTTYVYDRDKFAANQWHLVPEGYHVLLIDKNGRLLFEKSGKFSSQDVDQFLSFVKEQTQADPDTGKLSVAPAKEETKKPL